MFSFIEVYIILFEYMCLLTELANQIQREKLFPVYTGSIQSYQVDEVGEVLFNLLRWEPPHKV